jgi:hypothetical protein
MTDLDDGSGVAGKVAQGGVEARPTPEEPTMARRSAEQVESLLVSAGLREQRDGEAEELAALLVHKFAHDVSGDDEAAADELKIRRAFLRHRFTGPVMSYQQGDRYYSYLDTVLNMTSIAAGIAASLTAALSAPKGWTIILGVLVAGCQTFSQWLKPAQRAAHRGQAASDLRAEAWALLQDRDRYRGKSPGTAWSIFCDQVDKVEEREEGAEDKESGQGPAGQSRAGGG